MPRELIFLLFVICFVGIFWRHSADRKHVRKLQQDATQAFAAIAIGSQEIRYRLNGSTAVVERRQETGGLRGIFSSTADLTVEIYARNEHGERFLFRWNSGSRSAPYVKHLPSKGQ
jgi:hypothetical protein